MRLGPIRQLRPVARRPAYNDPIVYERTATATSSIRVPQPLRRRRLPLHGTSPDDRLSIRRAGDHPFWIGTQATRVQEPPDVPIRSSGSSSARPRRAKASPRDRADVIPQLDEREIYRGR